jgi:TonB family protein
MKAARLMTLITLTLMAPRIGGELSLAQSPLSQPAVVAAEAPIFIPWVFGKPGVGESVVEVKINPAGEVTSAECVGGSPDFPWRDHSFEVAAMRWRFSPTANGVQERVLRITFVLRIMPKGTHDDELTPIYTAPYQMEVRHAVFEPPANYDPNPDPNPIEGKPRAHRRKGNL